MVMAQKLKDSVTANAKYSHDVLERRRASSTKKIRGTGKLIPRDQRVNKKASVKHTFASWIRYFFGDVHEDGFEAGPIIAEDLYRAGFIAFWLSRHLFPGPPFESVSPSVFALASMLADGVRLPLSSLYLGCL